jgi:hypothetical protein
MKSDTSKSEEGEEWIEWKNSILDVEANRKKKKKEKRKIDFSQRERERKRDSLSHTPDRKSLEWELPGKFLHRRETEKKFRCEISTWWFEPGACETYTFVIIVVINSFTREMQRERERAFTYVQDVKLLTKI